MGAYEKIREAKQKGETNVVLTRKDFRGGSVLFNFSEIQRLQQEVNTIGRDCLAKDLELKLDYTSAFPRNLTVTKNSH